MQQKKNFSQIGQDLWILERTGHKKEGYFVEAGACDGIHLSNTYLLERDFQWTGICCEPNPDYFAALLENRSCHKDSRVLYDQDEQTVEFYSAGEEGGTLEDFKREPKRLQRRSAVPAIKASTVTLNTLLENYQAPRHIDYISLDTEGSELKILSEFDFSKWDVSFLTVEHNTQHRDDGTTYVDQLIALMKRHGYQYELNRWDMYFFR